jgi:hypothetical protein
VVRFSPSKQILGSALYLLGLRFIAFVLFSDLLVTALMKAACFPTAGMQDPKLD